MSIRENSVLDRDTLNKSFVSKTATGTQIMAGSLRLLGNIIVDGSTTINGSLSLNNNTISGVTYIYGQYGTIVRSIDEWLRINDNNSHTAGVYFGSSILRTHGEIQVGDNGSYFKVDASGNTSMAGTLTIGGATTFNGTLNVSNHAISNVGHITIADPGVNEGIEWLGGNGWKLYESPDDLTTNSGGNFQIVQGSTRRLTVKTDGKVDSPGGFSTNGYSMEYNATEGSLDFIFNG